MNWGQLLQILDRMTAEQLEQQVHIYSVQLDEYWTATGVWTASGDEIEVLGEGQRYISC